MQCWQQNERSDASWERICFYRKVVLGGGGAVPAPEIQINNNSYYFCFIMLNILSLFLFFLLPFIRKVNGPGTPRPLNRPKVSLANSLAANGLPDSTDNKDLNTEQEDDKDSRYAEFISSVKTVM